MSFPKYPKYKDSGVEWLGEVPEHWSVTPLKHIAAIDSCGCYGVEAEAGESAMPVATTAQIDSDGRFAVHDMPIRGFTATEIERYGCTTGDILVVKSSGSATNIISGKAGLVTDDTALFVFSNFLMRIRPTDHVVIPRFLNATLRSHLTRQRVEQMCSTTTYPNLKVSEYTSAPLPLPPLAEQLVIAAFLDRETAKIDALIAEQQRLIELLQEKRQAVISHAVTKGLNPDASMKDSGIEWLGEVPEHWMIPPVFARYEAVLGKMVDEKKATGSHPVPYLRNADVYWDQINVNDLPTLDIQPHERARFTVQRGDVLICEGGAGIGQTAIWQHEDGTTAFQKALHRLRPWDTTKEHPRYFFYCMRFVVESGVLLAGGTATIPHLTGEQLRRYRFPCPPLREQQAIVEYLDGVAQGMNSLHQEADIAITLLQERRSALISAAVTGQIDVRGLAGAEAA